MDPKLPQEVRMAVKQLTVLDGPVGVENQGMWGSRGCGEAGGVGKQGVWGSRGSGEAGGVK